MPKRRKPTSGGGDLLQARRDLGEASFGGDEAHGVWVSMPAPVRPVMARALELHSRLAPDLSRGDTVAVRPGPARIRELQETLSQVRELRNQAEDGFHRESGDGPREEDRQLKKVASAVLDRVHEAAYGQLVACQSTALALAAGRELDDFLRATQTSLEAAEQQRGQQPGDDEPDSRLPAFIQAGRLTGIQDGDAEESNRFTQLLLYIQFSLRSRDLRRHGDSVFERVRNSAGRPTAAWKDAGEISSFIYSVCRKEVNPRMWAIVAQPSDPVSAAVRYFTCSNDPEFPELRRDKSVFSFDNGVYLAASNEFLPYDDPESPFNSAHPLFRGETVPAKHFEAPFPRELHAATALDRARWRDVPTPSVEGIFSYQELPQAAIDMMYVTVGRLLHDVGRLDTFGYVGMIVGAAGTGKSTFCLHLGKIWEADDVGVLSNNCERQFALYPFMDKFLFVAPEVKQDFKLDQAEWQGITTGDPMSCAVKFKAARAVRWTTPGFFAGNQVPDWVDHGGSVLRRLLIWRFDKRVGVENGDLPAQLEAEMPAFLLKCAVAYLHTLETKGNAAMWTWVDGPGRDGYFWEQRRRLTAQLNPLESFLYDKVVKAPGAKFPFDEFKRSLREFCKENGFDNYKMTTDSFTTIFADHGLQKAVARYQGETSQVRVIECVLGCRLRTEADSLARPDDHHDAEPDRGSDRDAPQDDCDES